MQTRTKSSQNHKLFQYNPLEAKRQLVKNMQVVTHTQEGYLSEKAQETLNKEMKTCLGSYYGKGFSI
jgi:hypothetical protein